MQWSMPHRTLQVVAGLLVVTAVTGFSLGVINSQSRGRLPGERTDGAPGALIQATEATPLSQERIDGPPEPTPLTPEEKAKLDEARKAKAEAAAAAKLAEAQPTAPPTAATVATPTTPAPDRVGDLIENAPPPPEEPPH